MTYSEKLKHPKWQRKRLKILERDNFTCKYCGDTETELHVHHTKYEGEPHEAPDEYLETVCKYCHSILEIYKKVLPDTPILRTIKFPEKDGINMGNICVELSEGLDFWGFKNDEIISIIGFGKIGKKRLMEWLIKS